MTDEPTYKHQTVYTDANEGTQHLEDHRKAAEGHFGGHVHIVKYATSSSPRHDDDLNFVGHTYTVTSLWKKAPPEPAPVEAQAAPLADAQPDGEQTAGVKTEG